MTGTFCRNSLSIGSLGQSRSIAAIRLLARLVFEAIFSNTNAPSAANCPEFVPGKLSDDLAPGTLNSILKQFGLK